FTQELRLVSTSDGPWNWIVGAFYSDFEQDSVSREFAPGYDQFLVDIGDGVQLRPDDLEYIELLKDEFTEYAAFGELGYRITDAWQVTVGARWYRFENESSGGFDTPLYNTVLLGAPQDAIDPSLGFNDVDDDDVIYKFNTSYDINDDMMVFATVSEGYRLGGLNAVPECPDPLPPGQNVCVQPSELLIKSDTTTNYELGLRSTWLDNSLIVNGSVFFIEWDDVRVADVSEIGQAAISTNGGAAESLGLELEAQYLITDKLSLMGSYAYTKAELTDDALCLLGGDAADPQGCLDSPDDVTAFDGDRLPATPEHQGFLALNYALDLSNGSRIDLDWSATFSSDILTKVGERNFGESLDGYAVHNASATWFNEGLAVTLYADNVFDEYAETGVRGDRADITQFADFDSRRYYTNVLRPRQVGVRFVYNFDN
ncbi:MAG: TonB-dependent receptor, partial [Halioglobus sp.]|nr:TonB-dependent receptor [Halioglobus sp.]